MNFIYYIGAHLFYYIGQFFFKVTDFIARVSPADFGLIDFLYDRSCQSFDLGCKCDKKEWVWLIRRDNETDEEFMDRCAKRWPERREES